MKSKSACVSRAMRTGVASVLVLLGACSLGTTEPAPSAADDVEHFKYGSIGAEVNGYPYKVWRELPVLFKDRMPEGWATFGFLKESGRELPIGVSVRTFGVPRVGFNCATCHTSRLAEGRLLLGAPAQQLHIQAYLHFLLESAKDSRLSASAVFESAEANGRPFGVVEKLVYRIYVIPKIRSLASEASGETSWMLSRPPQGPGRTDAGNPWRFKFGLNPGGDQLVGTVDMPSIWNQRIRTTAWLHWDGNNNSLRERNLSAALAGGASEDSLDQASIERVARWTLDLAPPPFPFPVDNRKVAEGQVVFSKSGCQACHDTKGERYGESTDIVEVGTDEDRWQVFSSELLNAFATVGKGREWQFRHYRKSRGYANSALDGVWARAPYLHNGSIPTLADLLLPPEERTKRFFRGCEKYDSVRVGIACSTGFDFDTTKRGNSNKGHEYGTQLSTEEKAALLEFLKTL